MKYDIVVAHPYKHHAFPLVAGCISTGMRVGVALPLYTYGLAAALAGLPGPTGRRLSGYGHPAIPRQAYITGAGWQFRKLLSFVGDLRRFQLGYDEFIAEQILRQRFSTKILVTLQDYMPKATAAARATGALIWSDQILNLSNEAQLRIAHAYTALGVSARVPSDLVNSGLLEAADFITVPSRYTLAGILPRTRRGATVKSIPYGVAAAHFTPQARAQERPRRVRFAVRANSVRKGGYALLATLVTHGVEISRLCNGAAEFVFIGDIEPCLRPMIGQINCADVVISEANVPNADMPNLLRSCDAFIMPSLSESMSLAVAEAMACGLPCLISEYCGVDYFETEECGLLCGTEPDAFTQDLLDFIKAKERWAIWGRAARETAAAYDWDHYQESISKFCELIVPK